MISERDEREFRIIAKWWNAECDEAVAKLYAQKGYRGLKDACWRALGEQRFDALSREYSNLRTSLYIRGFGGAIRRYVEHRLEVLGIVPPKDEQVVCCDCGWVSHFSVLEIPMGWGADYFDDHYYKVNEVPLVEKIWSPICDEVVIDIFGEYHARYDFHLYEEIIKVLDLNKSEDFRLECQTKGVAWYNAISRYGTARRDQLGVQSENLPKLRECRYCGVHFFEISVWHPRFERIICGSEHLFCEECLSAAFLGGEERGIRKTKDEIGRGIAELADVLGMLPPHPSQFHKITLNPDFSEQKKIQVVDALMRIPSEAVTKDEFGSWFKALVFSGVLGDGALVTARGIRCLAKDGHECYSMAEKIIDDWLYQQGIPHEKEPPYPRDSALNPHSRLRADWKIGRWFVEFFGMLGEEQYDEQVARKRLLGAEQGLDMIELTPKDIPNLQQRLGRFISNKGGKTALHLDES